MGGNQSNADIQYFIQGPDLEKLAQLLRAAAGEDAEPCPTWSITDTTLRSGKPEVRLEIDRPRAADLGVSRDGYRTGAQHPGGRPGGLHLQCRRRSIRRASCARRSNSAAASKGWRKMTVPSTQGAARSASMKWCDIVPGTGPSSINRISRQRQVTLTGNLLARRIAGRGHPAVERGQRASSTWSPDYRSGLAGASKELGRTGYYFMLAFSLTFIFMYIVLAAQFEASSIRSRFCSRCRWPCRSASSRC